MVSKCLKKYWGHEWHFEFLISGVLCRAKLRTGLCVSWGAKGNISRIQLKSALRSEQGYLPQTSRSNVDVCLCLVRLPLCGKIQIKNIVEKGETFFRTIFYRSVFFFKLSSTNSYIIIICSDILCGHFMSVFTCILENVDHRCLKSVWFA